MKLIEKLYKISQDKYGDTAFGETTYDLKTDLDVMKGKWKYQIPCVALVSVLISGSAVQSLKTAFGTQEAIILSKVFTIAFGTGLPFTIILFLAGMYLCYAFRRSVSKDYTHVADGNFEISSKGTYGTAREMTDEERKAVFYKGPIEDNIWPILGADRLDNRQLYTFKDLHDAAIGAKTYAALNHHIAVVGSSQSGKTFSVIIPSIMQAIRRGESIITTSPKGELYEKTAAIARANGYKVKVINLNPDQVENSDSIHFLKYAISNPSDTDEVVKDVLSFCQTIITNTRSEGEKVEKFFEDCALSLLQAIILYLVLSPDVPEKDKTLGNVYLKLTEWGVSGLLANIGHLPIQHPAKRAFRTFMDSSDTVRQSSVSGLGLKLQILASNKVRNITDKDTVSLTAPGEEKCIYYIGMSVDEKETLKFLVSLYFSIQFQALIKLAKSKYARQGERLPVKVNFILDEFANCGTIPAMNDKLSVVRSYGIDIMIALQDINQLKNMYPQNDMWQTILSQCMTQILLKANDPVTEEFFSVKSGVSTVVAKSDRYQEGRADLWKAHPNTYKTEAINKRYALTPDEIRRLAANELLVFVSGYNYVKLNKFGMDKHPMYDEIVEEYIIDYHPDEGPDGSPPKGGKRVEADNLPVSGQDAGRAIDEMRAGKARKQTAGTGTSKTVNGQEAAPAADPSGKSIGQSPQGRKKFTKLSPSSKESDGSRNKVNNSDEDLKDSNANPTQAEAGQETTHEKNTSSTQKKNSLPADSYGRGVPDNEPVPADKDSIKNPQHAENERPQHPETHQINTVEDTHTPGTTVEERTDGRHSAVNASKDSEPVADDSSVVEKPAAMHTRKGSSSLMAFTGTGGGRRGRHNMSPVPEETMNGTLANVNPGCHSALGEDKGVACEDKDVSDGRIETESTNEEQSEAVVHEASKASGYGGSAADTTGTSDGNSKKAAADDVVPGKPATGIQITAGSTTTVKSDDAGLPDKASGMGVSKSVPAGESCTDEKTSAPVCNAKKDSRAVSEDAKTVPQSTGRDAAPTGTQKQASTKSRQTKTTEIDVHSEQLPGTSPQEKKKVTVTKTPTGTVITERAKSNGKKRQAVLPKLDSPPASLIGELMEADLNASRKIKKEMRDEAGKKALDNATYH